MPFWLLCFLILNVYAIIACVVTISLCSAAGRAEELMGYKPPLVKLLSQLRTLNKSPDTQPSLIIK
jgi:hypothetical protein